MLKVCLLKGWPAKAWLCKWLHWHQYDRLRIQRILHQSFHQDQMERRGRLNWLKKSSLWCDSLISHLWGNKYWQHTCIFDYSREPVKKCIADKLGKKETYRKFDNSLIRRRKVQKWFKAMMHHWGPWPIVKINCYSNCIPEFLKLIKMKWHSYLKSMY